MPFGFAAAAVGGALLGSSMGGGGGGSSGSTGAQQTGSTVYNTNIPQYAQPYVTNMLNATQSQLFNTDSSGNITGFNQYQPYTGMDQQALQNAQQAVAGFSPLQQQAQSSAANLQVPGQYGAATGQTMRGIMGANQIGRQMQGLAASANPQDFQNQVGGYMNPYIQQSLAPQLQLANQQYGIAGTQMAGQATGAGAFGGSRNALQQGLNQQNQMLAQNQLISQGYNNAFNAAQNQYNQSGAFQLQGLQGALGAQQQGMAGAAQLGNLGASQLAAQQGILGTQNQLGAQQQANAQQVINQGIQNYATAQQYPLMQLGTMSNMLRGLPMQSATTQQYQAAPSALTQTVGAAGTGAMLGSLYGKKEGGLLKTKKMASGGIASYGEGDIVESTESDLNQMPSSALNKELASTSSDIVKNKIKQILAMRAGAPMSAAGGGIIAFSNPDEENNQGVVKEDPAMVRQAQIEAAQMQAKESGYVPPTPTAPTPTSSGLVSTGEGVDPAIFSKAANKVGSGISSGINSIGNYLSGTVNSMDPNNVPAKPIVPAAAAPAQPPVNAAPAQPPAQPASGAITNAAPANAAPPNPAIEHANNAKASAQNTPHISTEQYARDRALANPDNAAKVFGLSIPNSSDEAKYLAAKEVYVGKNDVEGQVNRQEQIRQREEKNADQREKLIWAGAFAKMATTPGSLLVAGMTGVQSAIPGLISSKDKRTEAMNRIDDAIGSIYKSDRAERAGDFENAEKHKQEGIKSYLDAYKIYNEHIDKQAEISAKFAQTGLDKSILQYQKAQGQYQTEVEKIATEKQKDTQYGMDKRMQEMYATRLKQNPNDTEAKTKYDEISRRVAPKETDWNNRVNEIREYRDRFDTGRVPPKQGITQAAPQQNMPLYASNGKDRIVSNDGGRTWQPVGAK